MSRSDDERCMWRCLELAAEARRDGSAAVGALIVRRGHVIAEAREDGREPTGHAELVALREAVRRVGSLDLTGAVLYSNAEPCVMCAYAIRRTRLSRVVFGLTVPLGGSSSRYALLMDPELSWGPPPQIEGGVLEKECAALSAKPAAPGRRGPGAR